MSAKQTPLTDLLREVPRNAVANYEHSLTESSHIPYGRLCHSAFEEITRLRAELAEARKEEQVAHRLALDLECLLLAVENPAATKWWAEANATLESWRGLQDTKDKS